MKKILVATKLPGRSIKILKKRFKVDILEDPDKESLLKAVKNVHILLVRSKPVVDKDVIMAGKKLEIIGRAGTGLDNIDSETAKSRNIQVLNTPNANSAAVAELVFGIVISLLRKIREADDLMKHGRWAKNNLMGSELDKKTFGIIGVGKIGKLVARLGKAFDMKLIGFDPFLPKEEFEKLEIGYEKNLEDLLKKSDIISLHLPKTPQTKGIINKKNINKLKNSAIVVNCARGGIVDEKVLYKALKNNKIAGAGIDTWESEPRVNEDFAKLSNVIALPHIGANTFEAQEKCALDLINQILKIYEKI